MTVWGSVKLGHAGTKTARTKALSLCLNNRNHHCACRCLRRRQLHKFLVQFFLRFRVIEVERDAIDGAHFFALRRVEMTDAFGAFRRIDFVDFNAHVDCFVRALGLAHVAVDALIGNFKRHGLRLFAYSFANLAFERRTDGGVHKVFYVTA